jgi:hypothetical protein
LIPTEFRRASLLTTAMPWRAAEPPLDRGARREGKIGDMYIIDGSFTREV